MQSGMLHKIGREVLFLGSKEGNPRNGEGTFLRLKDNSILFVYSRFTGNDWHDECAADIAAFTSYDDGETWTDERIIFAHDENARNYMCPSLVRMNNGDVGLIFLRKAKENESGIPYFARSSDEGKTFTTPKKFIDDNENYFVIENDHAVRLQSGRIILPANIHSKKINGEMRIVEHGLKCIFASDDDGETWCEIAERQDIPFADKSQTGLQETTVYQHQDGVIHAFSRTDLGFQFECFSYDNCETWTEPSPNRFFSSPDAPLLIKRAGKHTLSVFNPIPNYTTRPNADGNTWGRTPLVCAVSEDDGVTFDRIYALEDDPNNGYCYPAIIEGEDYFLVSYYHSNNTESPLTSCKMVKVMFDEIR
ncbi:MAG: sialidase family protein [Acutalibacteraceae bacterium]|nr:sialidase family protein [Acutalibacteraceae bacterium]